MKSKLASGLLAMLMAVALPMNSVFASEVTLDSAVKALQYHLNVEWDQKDIAARDAIMAEFMSKVETLRKSGVSSEELFDAVSAQAFDAQTAKDLKSLGVYAKENKLSEKEVSTLLISYAEKSGKTGASWSSSGEVILGSVALIGLLALLIIVAANYRGPAGYWDVCWDPYYYEWYDCYVTY
jgi:hypothetical protein